jgi:hypothetical protein
MSTHFKTEYEYQIPEETAKIACTFSKIMFFDTTPCITIFPVTRATIPEVEKSLRRYTV